MAYSRIPIQSVGSEVAVWVPIVQYLWSGMSRQAKHGADGQHGYGLAEESCRVSPVWCDGPTRGVEACPGE